MKPFAFAIKNAERLHSELAAGGHQDVQLPPYPRKLGPDPNRAVHSSAFAILTSSPANADRLYLRARSSACSQDLVLAGTRKRPDRPG
jgi:hypothetical protein